MDTVKLSITEREQTGNGPARRLRADGRLPGVVYAKGTESKAISVDQGEFKAAMHQHGHNVVLELDLGDAAKPAKGKKKAAPQYAVVKEFQFHPTKRHLLHVDFHEVDLAVEIEGSVAIELTGTPAGLEDGGVVDWEHREVTVRALPSAMPEAIALDVTDLQIGHHLTVGALQAPAGTKILDDPEVIVVTLVPPRVEQVVAEAAEPEVIGGVKSEE
jgi:large subunit ribosomal protein L25